MIAPLVPALLLALPLQADVPTPASVLGFEVGADFELADHGEILGYFAALEEATDHVELVEVGTSTHGRPMVVALISSPANLARREEIQAEARALATVRGLDADGARALARDGVAVVHVDGGMHTTEAANAQHTMQLAYELLAGRDDPTIAGILDEVLLVLWPTLNPDGLDWMVEWYESNLGTPYEIAPMPFLYQEYVGHDNNRDAYMLNMVESRVLAASFLEFEPQIMYCQHQTSPFPTRIWLPPFSEPIGRYVHPLMTRTVNSIGMLMAEALERNGQVGAMHGGGDYDVWYAGYADYLPNFRNCAAFFTETALFEYATPGFYTVDDFPRDARDFRPRSLHASPWKGGWWRLRDAVDYMVTASIATLEYASKYREDLLYGRWQAGHETIARYAAEPPYAYFVPADQRDPMAPIELLERLALQGIEIRRLDRDVEHEGRAHPTGTWVVAMDQPFAELVRMLFEVQTYPDLRPFREAPFVRPYDATAWTLPYLMDVTVHAATQPLSDEVRAAARLAAPAPPAGTVRGDGPVLAVDAAQNNAHRAVNRALALGAEVSLVTGESSAWHLGGLDAETTGALVGDLSLRASRTDGHGAPVGPARVGVYRPWDASMDEGWTRWVLEQHEVPFASLRNADVRADDLRARFDVVLLCDMGERRLAEGFAEGEVPPRYVGGLGEAGARGLERFVAEGGTLVCLGASAHYAMDVLDLPVSDVLDGLDTEAFFAGGSILEVEVDAHHPVAAGLPARTRVFFEGGPVFALGDDFQGSVIARFGDAGSPLLSGHLHGEEHLRGRPVAVEVRHGRGRAVLFGFRPQWRGQTTGTFKALFQALRHHGDLARTLRGTPRFGR